jgi:hypothetical protein
LATLKRIPEEQDKIAEEANANDLIFESRKEKEESTN